MHPVYGKVVFLTGAGQLSQLPPDEGIEVAFAGRSNVGKSSAINGITGRKGLARVSKTPGRTQQINFFRLDDSRRLVDLPGYGFARAPQKAKTTWVRTVDGYLRRRRCLRGMVLLVDIRHPPNDLDWHLLNWCFAVGLETCVLLTKADKLSRGRGQQALEEMRRRLEPWGDSLTVYLFSAHRATGVLEVRAHLDVWFAL